MSNTSIVYEVENNESVSLAEHSNENKALKMLGIKNPQELSRGIT